MSRYANEKPTTCTGEGCTKRLECVRANDTRGVNRMSPQTCIRNGHCFLIEENTPEGNHFEKKRRLYLQELDPIRLRQDYRLPTNESSYECVFCVDSNTPHRIERVGAPAETVRHIDVLSRLSATIRRCTGCNRWDGPWSPFGDY